MSSPVTEWCNILYDFPEYARRERQTRDQRAALSVPRPQLTLALYRQGARGRHPTVPIPQEVLDLYALYRPTPLFRAVRFERALRTRARIYCKFEGQNPVGSHKLNSAIAQCYYFKAEGVQGLVTGTGAGQWGSALAWACWNASLECTVFMVGISYGQKPARAVMMRLYGATVFASPSTATDVGRVAATKSSEQVGSLAIATGEAIEWANGRHGVRFAVGSGENHVLLHQTIIGQEAMHQMAELGEKPDAVVACVGAGSNFGGIIFPFLRESRRSGRPCRFVAAEPLACPKLTRGAYAFDENDFSGVSPTTKMMTLGKKFIAPGIHAGGLRYHGTSPLLSAMYADGIFEAQAHSQRDVFETATSFARAEGIVVAPESAHALCSARALAARAGDEQVILVNISGHGHFDLMGYDEHLRGALDDGIASEERVESSLDDLGERQGAVAIHAG